MQENKIPLEKLTTGANNGLTTGETGWSAVVSEIGQYSYFSACNARYEGSIPYVSKILIKA
jgi:hypothetical protein